MKNLADCRVLLVDDAKVNLDILVEGLKFWVSPASQVMRFMRAIISRAVSESTALGR